MEFVYRKKDGSYCEEEEEEEEEEGQEDSTNKHNTLSMASTCSASSSHLHPLPPPPPSSSGAPSSSNAEAAAAAAAAIAKEHMFDKVATPSDVGKLNRLVIPKQHAERYFPLDHSANEKGLLLNFEDPTGKPWLFRYSYWNSSQSYVMTKGWSRFVKEKRLDAGDTVSFSRGVGESVKGRYFIDWKRRPEIHHDPSSRLLLYPRVSTYPFMPSGSNYPMVSFARSAGPWAGRLLLPTPTIPPDAVEAYDPRHRYSYRHSNVVTSAATSSSGGGQYFRSAAAATPPPDVAVQPASANATLGMPVVQQKAAAAKRVTLFGVNLDFQESDRQHPYQRPAPLQLQQQQQQQAFSSSSSSPSPTEQFLDLGL